MTSMNKPNVSAIHPQDRKLRIGLINTLTRPKISAIAPKAIQAFVPSIYIPGTIRTATTNEIKMMIQLMRNFISFS
jgi:hypothetical protein